MYIWLIQIGHQKDLKCGLVNLNITHKISQPYSHVTEDTASMNFYMTQTDYILLIWPSIHPSVCPFIHPPRVTVCCLSGHPFTHNCISSTGSQWSRILEEAQGTMCMGDHGRQEILSHAGRLRVNSELVLANIWSMTNYQQALESTAQWAFQQCHIKLLIFKP